MSPLSLTTLRHIGVAHGMVSERTQATLCIIAMLLAGPLAQVGGRRMWASQGFRFLAAVCRWSEVCLAQAFGWMLYGVALMQACLCIATGVDFAVSRDLDRCPVLDFKFCELF